MNAEVHAAVAHLLVALPLLRAALAALGGIGLALPGGLSLALDGVWGGAALFAAVSGQSLVERATAVALDAGPTSVHRSVASTAVWMILAAVAFRSWLRLESARRRVPVGVLWISRGLLVSAAVWSLAATLRGGQLVHALRWSAPN